MYRRPSLTSPPWCVVFSYAPPNRRMKKQKVFLAPSLLVVHDNVGPHHAYNICMYLVVTTYIQIYNSVGCGSFFNNKIKEWLCASPSMYTTGLASR